jgi:hypothetical protein
MKNNSVYRVQQSSFLRSYLLTKEDTSSETLWYVRHLKNSTEDG